MTRPSPPSEILPIPWGGKNGCQTRCECLKRKGGLCLDSKIWMLTCSGLLKPPVFSFSVINVTET